MSESHVRPSGFPAREWLAALTILAAAAAVRVWQATRWPLWYDELFTVVSVTRPLPRVLASAAHDVHPPLHAVLGWVWIHFGSSDLWLRAPSIALGLAALGFAWYFARSAFGSRAALFTLALLALHPWHVYISQEFRSYALLWCALGLSACAAWRWITLGGRRSAAMFVLGSTLALWTHYLAGVALAVQFVWGCVVLRRDPRRMPSWVGLHAFVGALFAPLVPWLLRQFARVGSEHWIPTPSFADLWNFTRLESFGAWYLLPLVYGLALWGALDPHRRRAASFSLWWGIGIVALCFGAARLGVRLFGVRYMMFALPGLFALVGAGLARLPRGAGLLAAGLLCAFGLRATLTTAPQPEAASLGSVGELLRPLMRPDDAVFHADTHTLLWGRRYFPLQRHRLLLGRQSLPYYEGGFIVAEHWRGTFAEAREKAASGGRWWAMAARPAGTDVRAASALFDTLSSEPAKTLGVVTVWSGSRPLP